MGLTVKVSILLNQFFIDHEIKLYYRGEIYANWKFTLISNSSKMIKFWKKSDKNLAFLLQNAPIIRKISYIFYQFDAPKR